MVEPELLPSLQILDQISSVVPQDAVRNRIVNFIGHSGEISEWLKWCRNNSKVKVTNYDVPHGILPTGIKGILHDVKVESKGCDDAVYHRNPDIRDKIARGNTVLTLHNSATNEENVDMVVFALRKFTGGMGDEDEDQPENEFVWQKYFLKPLENVDKIVVMNKENGEAAHFSARFIGGRFYFIGGSKNVHLIFRTREDIEKYTDTRFMVAKTICLAILDLLENTEKHKLNLLLSFLHTSRMTAIFEILLPTYQHVVDLSYLDKPLLKFLCFTEQYRQKEDGASLTAMPPNTALDLGKFLGLSSTTYETIKLEEFEQKMVEIRKDKGYEGRVMYFLDSDDNVLGLLKKKTSWYIILRAIREKIFYAMAAYKKNPGGFKESARNNHIQRIRKRLDEIQKWLGISDEEIFHWKTIGTKFLLWMIDQVLRTKNEELTNRGKFPPLWNKFLKETGTSEDFKSGTRDMDFDRDREESNPVQLLEPAESSPVIRLTAGPESFTVMSCIVRNLDLIGKNLGKLRGILNKVHGKVCKDKTAGFVSFHNLEKVSRTLEVSLQPLDNLSISIGAEILSGPELLERTLAESSKGFRNYVNQLQMHPVLSDENKVMCICPLASSSSLEVNEDTTDVLVVVHAQQEEQGLRILEAVLKQLYHAGIGNGFERKSIIVEKMRVSDAEGGVKLYPQSIDLP